MFGYYADKYDLFQFYGLASPILLSIALFLFTITSPLIPMLVFVIAASLNFTAVWSNICLVMPEKLAP